MHTSSAASGAAGAGKLAQPQLLSYCFYGAGSMAEAIVRGMLGRGLCDSSRIGIFNRSGGSAWRSCVRSTE